ncbi:MAG TPA: hypothetical protein DCP31_38900 [Cyanobacteria bacterium UBA8543]|nr:hypothetical protein [Cyanobacteria bacterium UBA8543]
MPTKSDRILSYLPGTFQVIPKAVVLYAVADAFGKELLSAENTLAEVMSAHWVDHADRGSEVINDLQRLAALYGLAPRKDEDENFLETVEEFRAHLKRYVRTFLEGTVTVQGILRVTAEVLGLQIADDYKDLDTWWNRSEPELVSIEPRGDDAASLVFGVKEAKSFGSAARPALIKGTVNLSTGVNLQGANRLQLKVDNGSSVPIDLLEGVTNPASVSLEEIVSKINTKLNATVAHPKEGYLQLASPTLGATSRLEVQDVTNDAGDRILGLAPRIYQGSDATAAQVTGTVDLSSPVTLERERYLRLLIDGRYLAELDLTDGSSATRTLDQIRDAINNALTINVATHNNRYLTLTSPTTGAGSSITFQQPAAQDATARLFGAVPSVTIGQDAQPARITGKRELTTGIDLSQNSNIRLRIDARPVVTINCTGENAANTQPEEIVTAINTALATQVASYNGRFIALTSPTRGTTSQVVLETPTINDATEEIFGISPRIFQGAAATTARIVGTSDLSDGVDLRAVHRVQIAVDGKAPVVIDLRSHADDVGKVTLKQLQDAINEALVPDVANNDGTHLFLVSPSIGSASSVAIAPSETINHRRFVTRARIIDEATQKVFGFIHRDAQGTAATKAKVIGNVDLSHSVNLQVNRFLRLSIDGQPPQEVDFATTPRVPRPRAAMLKEIVAAINQKFNADIASDNGKQLVLVSPHDGANSSITFLPPRGADAISQLLGVEPGTFRGQEGTRVTFVGTVDLSAGVTLEANAAIKLGKDGGTLQEISIGDAQPSTKTVSDIVEKINQNPTLGPVFASHDGQHIILTSSQQGEASRIEFAQPSAPDATRAIFGITAPRSYRGINAKPAQIVGTKDLSNGVDLRVARFLKLSAEGKPAVEIDCAPGQTDPVNVTLTDILNAINNAITSIRATTDGKYLTLTSTAIGTSARIDLLPYTAGDARETLLDKVPDVTQGSDPLPATITGEVDLLGIVNLSKRGLVRFSVDGNRPVDIDITGAVPEQTFLNEIIAKINAVFPGLATATEDDHLRLISPTAGEESQLSLLPLRYLELIEYPLEEVKTSVPLVRHGDRVSVVHDGKDVNAIAKIQITAPQGVVGSTLVNETLGWQIRLFTVLAAGDTAHLWRDVKLGLQVEIKTATGESRLLPGTDILVGPIGAQTWVPFAKCKYLSGDDTSASLQLNNPLAPNIVVLRAAQRSPIIGNQITVAVKEATIPADNSHSGSLVGQLSHQQGMYRLLGQNQAVLAQLQAGGDVSFTAYENRVVVVRGTLHEGEPPLMIVHTIANVFDVTIRFHPQGGDAIEDKYTSVTIGTGSTEPDSLVSQINVSKPSQLVKAEELDKATVLTIPPGHSQWIYLDCYGSRFNQANFNSSYFPGRLCTERGVFNVSHFVSEPPELVSAVFTASDALPEPGVQIDFNWMRHRLGAFSVNLPADLPARFGGKFNQARFSSGKEEAEFYPQAVTEPSTDAYSLVNLIATGNAKHNPPIAPSKLVTATEVSAPPLGWQPVTMPFRKPQYLTLGRDIPPGTSPPPIPGKDGYARIYIKEKDVDKLIELKAKEPGAWGNKIAVSVRQSGPAMFDVTISYNDSYFENARVVVLGGEELPTLTEKILEPGAIGVLQAKAAGVKATVTRDTCKNFEF